MDAQNWATITGYGVLLSLYLVVLLSLRFSWIERALRGFPRALSLHHALGLCLVLGGFAHGLVSLLGVLPVEPWYVVFGYLFDPDDPVSMSGTVAWLLFLLLTVFALSRRLARRPWLWIHRLSLLGLALVLWHGWELSWGRRDDWGLVVVWGVGWGILLTLALHLLWPRLLYKPVSFVVQERCPGGDDWVKLVLKLEPNTRPWRAGQFGYFRFFCERDCGVSQEAHPFTLMRCQDERVDILVKVAGDDTLKLQNIRVGTRGEVQGPYGRLLAVGCRARSQVWIAGGMGVIPFVGLLEGLRERAESPREVRLIFLLRPGRSSPFVAALDTFSAVHPWFHWVLAEDDPEQPAGIERLANWAPEWQTSDLLLVGPHAMVEHWKTMALAAGIARRRIHTEDFLR